MLSLVIDTGSSTGASTPRLRQDSQNAARVDAWQENNIVLEDSLGAEGQVQSFS